MSSEFAGAEKLLLFISGLAGLLLAGAMCSIGPIIGVAAVLAASANFVLIWNLLRG